jgi:hypothetical protein
MFMSQPRPGGRGGMPNPKATPVRAAHQPRGHSNQGRGHGHGHQSDTIKHNGLGFDMTQSMHVIIDALRDNNVETDRLDHFLVDFVERKGSIGEDEFDIETANIALRMDYYQMLYIACLNDHERFPIFRKGLLDKVLKAINACNADTPELVKKNLKRLQSALRK